MQEKFWLESEVSHRELVSWWKGFSIGLLVMFGSTVLIGLYL